MDEAERREDRRSYPRTVKFIEPEPEKEVSQMATVIKAAEDAEASKPVKVKVIGNYRVVHEGTPYTGGDVAEVPADIADAWIQSGWAQPVPSRGSKK